MGITALLSPLASLVAFIGFIWLLIVAFKRSALWGIGVLLLSPITAIIFAIKYWQEAKKPFLTYMVSSVLSFALFLYSFSAMGGFEMLAMAGQMSQGEMTDEQAAAFIESTMDRMDESGMLSAADQQKLEQMKQHMRELQQGSAKDEQQPDIATRAVRSTPSSPAPLPRVPSVPPASDASIPPVANDPDLDGYAAIPVRDAADYLGKVVRVVEKGGVDYKGTLADAQGDVLMLEKYLSGGTITVELRTGDIRLLEVLYR